MYTTFALAVGWWLCLGTQELLYYSCQDLRFAAFCSAGLVSRSDGFGAQQRVGLSPLRGDPQPCCALQTGAASKPWGGSGISSDVIQSAFLLRRDPACSHVNRASALRSARGHDPVQRQSQSLAPMAGLALVSFTSATACARVLLNSELCHPLDTSPGLCLPVQSQGTWTRNWELCAVPCL